MPNRRRRFTAAAAAVTALSAASLAGLAGTPAVAAVAANSAGASDALSTNLTIAVGPAAHPFAAQQSGCKLANGVQHVFYLGFDNFHLRRDNSNTVANNGDVNRNTDTSIPSDLEQVPALYNFLRGTSNAGTAPNPGNYADSRSTGYSNGTSFPGGAVLANHHTPLISHTSVDFTTTYSGVYGDKHGVAVSQNSIPAYTGTAVSESSVNGPVATASGFSYWTDPLGIGTDTTNVLTTKDGNGNAVNAPAPWVPFTRAGCDVGAVSATGMVAENANSIKNAYGVASTEFSQINSSGATKNQAVADYEGFAVHCAINSTVCKDGAADPNSKVVADTLPAEPGGYPASADPTHGYSAILGQKYAAPAINDVLNGTTSGAASLPLIRSGSTTDDFPGFNGEDGNYSLGTTLDMQKAGIPITFGYLSDAHDCHSFPYSASSGGGIKDSRSTTNLDYGGTYSATSGAGGSNPCAYTITPGSDTPNFGAFGSGEQGYTNYLTNLNSDFQSFFDQANAQGYTTANTEFVFYSDENDHTSESTPLNATCDGVTTPCQWTHSGNAVNTTPTPGQLGEVTINSDSVLPAADQHGTSKAPGPQPYFVNNDSAPDYYLSDKGSAAAPAQTDANVRQFERDLGTATYQDPYDGTTKNLTNYEADQTQLNTLHMVTADPARTPTVTAFAPGEDYVESGQDCSGGTPVCSNAGFGYIHGDFAPETNTTWAGFAGPGVSNTGPDTTKGIDTTWTDHVDTRATLLGLLGLTDDYVEDGRIITQITKPGAVSSYLGQHPAVDLANLQKKLDAPVYESADGTNDGFATATLVADTTALKSNATDDSTYTDVESRINKMTAQRNLVVNDIKARLQHSQATNTALDSTAAANDQATGNCLLTAANALKAFAAAPTTAPAPTDCSFANAVPAALPDSSHAVLLVLAGGLLMAGFSLALGRRRNRRQLV